jgi:hypothetical protein
MIERAKTGRILPLVATGLVMGLTAVTAAQGPASETFAESQLYVELNDTDGDLGLHGLIDGEPWTMLTITGPDRRHVLQVAAFGSMRRQGLTEIFFESAEPDFDELAPEEFFSRFREGTYRITGRLQEGGRIASTAVLSHVLAAPPENIFVNGLPAAESCDAEELPTVTAPVTIDWDPVTTSHPELGKSGAVTISRYQFFVEREGVKLSVDLPPTLTSFQIPASITSLGDEFKFEIIARTSTGNNTAVESCFRVS